MKEVPEYIFDTIFFEQVITLITNYDSKCIDIYYTDDSAIRIFTPITIFLKSCYEN